MLFIFFLFYLIFIKNSKLLKKQKHLDFSEKMTTFSLEIFDTIII